MEKREPIRDKANGCPFGHNCDACNLYIPLYRHTSPTEEPIEVWSCAYVHLVTMTGEVKQSTHRVQQAVESRGNAQIERQDAFLQLAHPHRRIQNGNPS